MLLIGVLIGLSLQDIEVDRSLADLVANVTVSEDLLRDIEFVVEKDYRYVLNDKSRRSDGLTQNERQTLRIVLQQGDRYRHLDQSSQYHSKDALENLRIIQEEGYDSQMSRFVQSVETGIDTTRIANLHEQWFDANGWVWPHTFLMSRGSLGSNRLSEYLNGSEALGYHLSVQITGHDEIQELQCIRVLCKTWVDGQTDPDERLLWISPERNFLPIKTVFYGVDYSREIPLEEGVVVNLQEIAPGIWLPSEWNLTVWDEVAAAKGKRVQSNLTTWKIKQASLDPQYDISLFRDIPIPPGTHVYNLRHGEIVSSYQVPPELQPPPVSTSRSWVLMGNLVALGLVAVTFVIWKARQRRRTPKSA